MRAHQDQRYVISLLLMAGAFVVTMVVLFRGDTSPEMIGAVVSAWVTTGVATTVAYWLGSSKGSADKGETLREQVRGGADQGQQDQEERP